MFRSILFAPGNEPRKVQKVGQFGADAVVLDLEDAVPDAEKAATRQSIHGALDSMGHLNVYVRINSLPTGMTEADVRGVAHPHLRGVVLPKTEAPAEIAATGEWLGQAEKSLGLPEGSFHLIPLIESTKGVLFTYEIVQASPRVPTVIFGSADYTLDLDIPAMEWSPEGYELMYARTRLVVACRAAGIQRPVDGPYLDVFNEEGLQRDAILSKKIGFQGKLCIHPKHVEIINRIFTPSPEEADFARKVMEDFEKAESSGSASITVDGKFVDYAVYYKAKKIVNMVQAIEKKGGGKP